MWTETKVFWHQFVLGHRVRRNRLDENRLVECLECDCGKTF